MLRLLSLVNSFLIEICTRGIHCYKFHFQLQKYNLNCLFLGLNFRLQVGEQKYLPSLFAAR